MNYIALAIAPGLAICMYIFYKDVYNKEPGLNLLISFILGGLAILPAIGFEKSFSYALNGTVSGTAIFAYAIVAFSEEFSKFIGLRLYAYKQKSFDEPLDGIVYAVMVSMGFATVENIMYVMKYAELGQGYQIAFQRMFLSVPAHATFAVVMGYYVGKAKFDSKNSAALIFMGLLSAIFFHGTFDFFLFVKDYTLVGQQTAEGLLAGGAIVSFITAIILSRRLIRRQRAVSLQMFKDNNTVTTTTPTGV
jgi:RsiW-degrading membrane proteinase PrsW (M82 family)